MSETAKRLRERAAAMTARAEAVADGTNAHAMMRELPNVGAAVALREIADILDGMAAERAQAEPLEAWGAAMAGEGSCAHRRVISLDEPHSGRVCADCGAMLLGTSP